MARQAANILCHSLAPEKTVRICLGSAFTKDTGQRALVRNAQRLIAVEGCAIDCSSRMMNGAIDGLTPEVIVADRLCDFDRKLFGVEEMPAEQIRAHAQAVARKIADTLKSPAEVPPIFIGAGRQLFNESRTRKVKPVSN